MAKILIINNDLKVGGIQKSLIAFLNFMVGANYQIDLLIWEEGALKKEVPPTVNIIQHHYPPTSRQILGEKNFATKVALLRDYLLFRFFSNVMKKPWLYYPKIAKHYDFAVSYTHNGYPRFFTIDGVSAPKKYVWFHHGSYFAPGKAYALDKKYFAEFDKIVTVSKPNKKMLENHFPALANNIVVVPNMVDARLIRSQAKEVVADFPEGDYYRFVTVSRFSNEKGLSLAIAIAAELHTLGIGFKWYFIGDGETFPEIESLIKQKGLHEVCFLLAEKTNPYPYINGADVYIQTSFVESQSITLFEALVLKKLIVTTDLPVLREALDHGRLGKLCTPEVGSFVESITELLNDKNAAGRILQQLATYEVSNEIAQQQLANLFYIPGK